MPALTPEPEVFDTVSQYYTKLKIIMALSIGPHPIALCHKIVMITINLFLLNLERGAKFYFTLSQIHA